VGIGGVFLLHLARQYFPGGAFGVDVFFVLSAYLITGILLGELCESGSIDFASFYWRRIFRLAPALILWLVLIATPTAVLEHASGSSIAWSTAAVLLYFSDFLEAWTHHVGAAYDQSWSLAVEEQFYLVWPLLLLVFSRRLGRRSVQRVIIALVAGSVVIAFAAGNYFLPTGHLVALALGSWAAFYEIAPRARFSGILGSALIAFASAIVFVIATFVIFAGIAGTALALAVDGAATLLLLHCALAPESIPSRLLASAVPRWIGQRSYGVYLYGLTAMQLVPLITHLSLHFAAPIDVLVTAALVAASYTYVEIPIRTRGRLWLKERVQLLAAPVATDPPPVAS